MITPLNNISDKYLQKLDYPLPTLLLPNPIKTYLNAIDFKNSIFFKSLNIKDMPKPIC